MSSVLLREKQIWMFSSRDGCALSPCGTTIRLLPAITMLSPRWSTNIESATVQSLSEQHDFGYHEWARAALLPMQFISIAIIANF